METLVFTYFKIIENNGEYSDRGSYAEFPRALKAMENDYDWWDPNKKMWICQVNIFRCDDGEIKIKETVICEKRQN